MKDAILIKGNKHGLTIIINDKVDFSTIKQALYKKLNDSRKFFGSSKVSLTFEGKTLSVDEQQSLIEIIQKASDLDIVCIIDSLLGTPHVLERENITNFQEMENKHYNDVQIEHYNDIQNTKSNYIDNSIKAASIPENVPIPENAAIFHKGTLRSGQEIISDSSIIIMGNVHNGASVSAKGNVIVIGKLSGCVHAGKDGNQSSFVVALNMSPTQLRIADIFGRSPDKKSKILNIPQIAYVEDERIIIENINRNIYQNLNFINYD